MPIPFDNGYARLPERFFARVRPTPVERPGLLRVNGELARLLRIDPEELASEAGIARLAGNELFEGSEPIALAYAGHQFGGFVPQLGDGRAILLGEVIGEDGRRRDLQLKGAGRTPFSRGGDGRAALGPVLREYLVSEAMHALGVPTTRALAAVTTGERVYRDDALPGAILTRVAASHLRVGTFEYFAARRDREALERLVAYALDRHYATARDEGRARGEAPALTLLDQVIGAQARLVARWMGVGFVHGVMNTDNTSISGETIDYGPCAFLDAYDPQRKFSSIDRGGRYAYGAQPRMALWNLARLAEALLVVMHDDEDEAVRVATARLETFPARFDEAHAAVLRAKLGLLEAREDDAALAAALLERMADEHADFTRTFRALLDAGSQEGEGPFLACFTKPDAIAGWLARWRARRTSEAASPGAQRERMRTASPAFIPRNHRVEAMIAAAAEGDLAPFERLLGVLARPYDDQPEAADLAEPPGEDQWSYKTFCGT
jgi:uncharacterized protein YdiU (UPF0061 family)